MPVVVAEWRVELGRIDERTFRAVCADTPPLQGAPDATLNGAEPPGEFKLEVIRADTVEDSFVLHTSGPPAVCGNVDTSDLHVYFDTNDFNFDGYADASILLDYSGAYLAGTYAVVLFDHQNQRFQWAPELSALTQKYMGMFQVDARHKLLRADTKDGCCDHTDVVFAVRDNRPVLVRWHRAVVQFYDPGCRVRTELKLGNGPLRTWTRACAKDEMK